MISLFRKKVKEEPNSSAMLDTISRLNKESIENLEFISKSLDLLLSLSIAYIKYPEYTVQISDIEEPKTDYYNMKQIAQMTGIGINTLTKYCNYLIKEGKIRYVLNGKNSGKLYSKDDVNTIISYYRQKNPRKVTKIAKLS